jgi:hypothetical protein
MSFKIYEDFLHKNDLANIQEVLQSNTFPWYYNNFKTNDVFSKNTYEFQFTHIFYNQFNIQSNFFEVLNPILNKINPTSLIRIKANLNTIQKEIQQYPFHTDFKSDKDIKTGIFYVNTNNGKTVFKDNTVSESIENRFICFCSNIEHAATTHTDTKTRIVININWI